MPTIHDLAFISIFCGKLRVVIIVRFGRLEDLLVPS